MTARVLLFVALVASGCRSGLLPAARPLQPLRTATAEEAVAELQKRRDGIRSIAASMRVRVTTPEKTQSFRARLTVSPGVLEITAFTPLGTPAFAIRTKGHQVEIRDHLKGETLHGSVGDLSRLLGVFAPSLPPAEMAMLLLGFPVSGATIDATPNGLARAVAEDVTIDFSPPVHPPRLVTVTRRDQRAEIEYLEIVAQ